MLEQELKESIYCTLMHLDYWYISCRNCRDRYTLLLCHLNGSLLGG